MWGCDNDEATIDGKVTQSGSLTVESDLGDTGSAVGTVERQGARRPAGRDQQCDRSRGEFR